jgi:glycolate oxidase FAD binding subunit
MTLTSSIANILGAERVRIDMETRSRYAIGDLTPAEVVSPNSAAEVVEIVKHAAAERHAVVATGARTKLEMGAPPSKYDLAVDLSEMNRIVAYDPGDLTLSVEPGVKLADLARTLAEHGQMLPLGTPWAGHATIGGTIASGIDAPERQLYGTPRDYLLGAEFVTGDGVFAKSGGRVVKNVTGYDMHKLLIGSFGTLGIITRLNFKTFPLPQNRRTFVARFMVSTQAFKMRDRVMQSSLSPITLDILSAGIWEALAQNSVVVTNPWPGHIMSETMDSIVIECSGSERVLARYERDLQQMAEQSGAEPTGFLPEKYSDTVSRSREFIPLALACSPATTLIKFGVLPSKLTEVWKEISIAAGKVNLRAVIRGGVGVGYIAMMPIDLADISDEVKRHAIEFTQAVQAITTKAGGYALVQWAPRAWKREMSVWGTPPTDLSEMRKLKSALDPQNILSSRRFVGGI